MLRVTCNNRELVKVHNEPNIVNIIKSSRLRCEGHERMDENKLPIEILWTNPGGQWRRGRQKSRWIDGVYEGARKLGCRNWRAAAQDRDLWRHCLRRPSPTQDCRAEDDDDDDDDDVLLAILTSYKHRLVRICVVFEAFRSIKSAKFSLPSSLSIPIGQRSSQSSGDLYLDALGYDTLKSER